MDLSNIIEGLVATPGVFFVVSRPGVSAELRTNPGRFPEFQAGGWAELSGTDWHTHVNLDMVQSVEFVEQHDHGTIPFLYYVSFLDHTGQTIIQAYFASPYLDEKEQPVEFQAEKLRLFQEMRDRFISKQGFSFVVRQGP